jgi:hypothetical protein
LVSLLVHWVEELGSAGEDENPAVALVEVLVTEVVLDFERMEVAG